MVVQNVMFQIERLWVRSLAPTVAATGGGGKGEVEGGGGKDVAKDEQPRGTDVGNQNKLPCEGKGDDGGMIYDSRSVLSPTLLYDTESPSTTSACTTCQQNFVPEDNAWDSCRCDHAGVRLCFSSYF